MRSVRRLPWLRWVLTLWLLWAVLSEAGPWTALALFLVASRFEVDDFLKGYRR